ncbi:MAG: DNA recombination protein RmuC [Candidatus Doudnabacteria bacterium]|nr:DNA recombination protein RmuC [Candidatus Doudnabacteria bacterium]
MNSTILYLILGVFLAGFGVLVYIIIGLKKQAEKPSDDQSLKIMMEWMKEIKQGTDTTREGVQKSINETNKAINERLDNAGRVIAQLTKELGGISQVGPDIRRLTETLASPKLRGNFGEEMLENMLSQALPKSGFEIQHKFKNGEVVDAIIYVGEKILPIDSKFSMENFRLYKEATTEEAAEALKKTFLKDVKKRIDEIHKKYILPQENTFDFALMYIPSEGVFSEVLDDSNTLTYGRDKKVYFVSPNTLYHHLQIILLSLRGQKVNQAAQQILAMISGIKQESDKFGRNLEVLGNHIKNAGNTMGTVTNDFAKLKTSITNASSLKLEDAKEPAIVQKLLD